MKNYLKLPFALFLVVVQVTYSNLFAQNTIHNAVHTDTLKFSFEEVEGSIQWQISYDSLTWENIPGATNFSYHHVYNTTQLNQFFRASIEENDCPIYFSPNVKVERDLPTYYWSDFQAWGSNQKPQAGEEAIIQTGRRIILDENPPNLSGINVSGILEFMDKDLLLTTDYILVHGTLQIGTEENPFQSNTTITLTGNVLTQNIMEMGTRGIMVMGGNLELHGVEKSVKWTKINQHIPAGTSSMELIQNVDWNVSDEIVLAPTDYYLAANGNSITQKLSIQSISNSSLQCDENINAFRWGLLQYATSNGMSLTPDNLIDSPEPDNDTVSTPKILDERACVGNLTRNIVIQAPDDNLWNTNGFGAHIMIMSSSSSAHINSIEIKRGGQRGRLGRYPIHWHMLSYNGTQTLADATGQYIQNSSIHSSKNRGIVIHGTNGLLVKNNIVYDVEGHGIFTEDAVERRNVIDSNLVLHIRNPQLPANLALKQHEVGERGSSGFWLSNPDNVVTNNVAADCGTNGFWIAFPSNPWGESSSVLGENGLIMNPSRIRFGVFDNNVAHSNGLEGIMLDFVEIDNEGNVFPRQYASTTNGVDPQWPNTTLLTFKLSNYKVWKNSSNGIWDRARRPHNYGVVSADNCGRFFAGSGDDGIIERSLVIGTSLNFNMNGMERPVYADPFLGYSNPDPVGFATYHSTFDIKNNIVINFQAIENQRSGVFSTDDYYTRAVEKGHARNTNNFILNSHPGVKLRAFANYFTLASCLWDPQGIWGPEENYFVYDDPFLTHNKPITQVAPSTAISGGVSVPGPFYGFEGFVLHGIGDTPPQNQSYMDLMGLHVRRLDANLQEVATWTVEEAEPNYMLQHMRDFATSPDGIYELSFPQEAVLPTNFQVNVENMQSANDQQVIGIQFDGTLNPIVLLQSPGSVRNYALVNSLNEVIASNGETYWQDTQNNLVWVKIQGGHWQYWTNDPLVAVPTSDELLYHPSVLRIFQP